MKEILAMTGETIPLLLFALWLIFTLIVVPFIFFKAWLFAKPSFAYGNLHSKSRSKKARRKWAKVDFTPSDDMPVDVKFKALKLKGGAVKILAPLAEDLGRLGANPVTAAFVSLGRQLCAFDNGQQVFYRHKNTIKAAFAMGLGAFGGGAYWGLTAPALPCLLMLPIWMQYFDSPQAVNIFSNLGPLPQIDPIYSVAAIFIIYIFLNMFFWISLEWLRANTIVRRVEKLLNTLDTLANRPTPALERNPLAKTGLAFFMLILIIALGVAFWIFMIMPVIGESWQVILNFLNGFLS